MKCRLKGLTRGEPDRVGVFVGLLAPDNDNDWAALVRVGGSLIVEAVHPSRVVLEEED